MSNELTDRIIMLIERNRISSTEVADALGKSGVLPRIQAVNGGKHISGKVKYAYVFDESNWSLHEQVGDVDSDCILYVDAFNCGDKAIFGDLVAKFLILYRRIKAVVVNGSLRDIPNLKKHGYPLWCTGYTPLGCFNKPLTASPAILAQVEERKKIFEGGILTCDESGCTLISKDRINESTYRNLDLIELQEDIWFYCIDTLKWNTYETVCLKNYLKNKEVLPKVMMDKLSDFDLEK